MKCEHCGLKEKLSKFTIQCYLQALLNHDQDRITVTFFDDARKQTLAILGQPVDTTLNEDKSIYAFSNAPLVV